jgi:hypothetical protein
MDSDTLKLVAAVLAAAWIVSVLLALTGGMRGGAYLNALVAAAVGSATLPSLGAAFIDRDEYVHRYGVAATEQLPLAISVLCLSLLGVSLSLAAFWRGLGPFAIGWFANAPVVAFALYLAFWFHSF